MFVSVTQYAAMHGKDAGTVRKLILAQRLPAQKIGNQWAISENEPFPADARVKSGKYRDWRKPSKQEDE